MYAYLLLSIPLSIAILVSLYIYQRKRGKEKTFLFYSGLCYILLGLPIVYSWFLYVALVSIALGVLFLLLSKFKMLQSVQVFLSILPIFAFVSLIIYTESSYNIFLIPKGYTGRVLIVHSCKEGASREYEGRYRVYRISKEGLLKTRFSFAGSSFDSLHSTFFYVDENQTREPIEGSGITKDPSKVSIQGLWTLQATRTGDTFIDFIVDTPVQDHHSYRLEENKKWQREIDSCAR